MCLTEQLGHFCLTEESPPAESRIHIYRRHVRRKISRNLEGAFPLAYHILSQEQWDEMVDRFLAEDPCSSPFFWQVPKFFVQFAKKKGYAERFHIPYLEDLLDFEWLEIEMFMMPNESEQTRIVTYSYPVFEKNPREKGVYHLYAFRHPKTKEVHFVRITPFYHRVLELLKECSEEEALVKAAEECNVDAEKALIKGKKFLQSATLYFSKTINKVEDHYAYNDVRDDCSS